MDPNSDDALIEYSELVSNGLNINVIAAKDHEEELKKQNKEEMAHAEETPNVVEYSMTLAGNSLEKPKP